MLECVTVKTRSTKKKGDFGSIVLILEMNIIITSQLVFGRDIILNAPFIADWEAIWRRNKNLIDKNNQLENKTRKPHTYKIRDKVLRALPPLDCQKTPLGTKSCKTHGLF